MCGCCCGKDEEGEKAELTNPIKNRGCTDILVLLVFIAFWAGMIYIAVFSIGHGDAFRLVYGYDSFGNTCDEDNTDRKIENVSLSGMNMKGKEFVFFLDITNPKKSMRLCVNRCPDTEITTIDNLKTYAKSESINLCRYDVSYENYSENSLCPKLPVMASDNILNYCIPKSWTSFATPVQNGLLEYLNKFDVFYKVVRELCMIWRKILILCFVALGFAAAMVLLIRFFARIIVWVIVTLAIVGSIVATAFLWWTYFDIKSTISEQKDTGKIPILDIQYDSEEAFLIYSIIATVLTVVLLLVLLIMRKRISLVVALFHEAGECVAFMPCILLHPVFTFIVLVFFFAYWIIVLAYLSTSEKARLGDDGFVTYDEHEMVSYFWWYHLIGLIWTSEFIVACQQLVVSGAVASWYFARDKEDVNCALCTATSLLIFHHLGSVAFGAFIITLVKLPRWILMYINKKLKKSENDCARYCLKCCICCLWCLEKCLKYLNQNAYTVVAIRGSNFCSSAKKAFLTLLKNSLRVVAINSVGDFILFLGKIGVMAATAAVGIIWLKDSTGLHYYPIPVLLTCVFAFFVAHCFLSTYEMVIDAIFLCFCEDCEINDGSADRPFYASLRLQKFIEESSRNFNTLSKPDTGGETETAKV